MRLLVLYAALCYFSIKRSYGNLLYSSYKGCARGEIASSKRMPARKMLWHSAAVAEYVIAIVRQSMRESNTSLTKRRRGVMKSRAGITPARGEMSSRHAVRGEYL